VSGPKIVFGAPAPPSPASQADPAPPAAVAPPPPPAVYLGPPGLLLPPSLPCDGLVGGVLPLPPDFDADVPPPPPPPEPPSAPSVAPLHPLPPPPPPADVNVDENAIDEADPESPVVAGCTAPPAPIVIVYVPVVSDPNADPLNGLGP